MAAAEVSSCRAGGPAGAAQQQQQQLQLHAGAPHPAARRVNSAGPGGPLAVPATPAAPAAAALEAAAVDSQVRTAMEQQVLLQSQLVAAAQMHQGLLARLDQNMALLQALVARSQALASGAGAGMGAPITAGAVPAGPQPPALAATMLRDGFVGPTRENSAIRAAWPAAPAPVPPGLSSAAPALPLPLPLPQPQPQPQGQDELWPAAAPALQLQTQGVAHLEPAASIALPLQQQQQQGAVAPAHPATSAPRPAVPSLPWDELLLDGTEHTPATHALQLLEDTPDS